MLIPLKYCTFREAIRSSSPEPTHTETEVDCGFPLPPCSDLECLEQTCPFQLFLGCSYSQTLLGACTCTKNHTKLFTGANCAHFCSGHASVKLSEWKMHPLKLNVIIGWIPLFATVCCSIAQKKSLPGCCEPALQDYVTQKRLLRCVFESAACFLHHPLLWDLNTLGSSGQQWCHVSALVIKYLQQRWMEKWGKGDKEKHKTERKDMKKTGRADERT